ncbi:hypothetical protein AYJ05_11550 [Corynebacterium stationis]|uniref:Uncharacterized protein n=1 Tax=Corynebacterium stationis TaxID=1705 RepID=A0A177ILT2_9CORY|nr:hypothetical protein [Corynebacterium stationis]OAH29788.1 hypothetical protein AYJ05_11550 [Corynebacterium stationis]
MKKKKLTSLTVALGIGVMLSPAVASAQEEIGSQPGTETPVDSAEEEPTASESAGVQPGTEAPQAEVEDTSQPVESTVQPGTETQVIKPEKNNKAAGQNPSNAEVDTPVEQSVEETVVEPAPQVAQPGTEEPQKPVDETPVVDEAVEQPLAETPVEPVDEAPAVEYIPVAQEEEIEPAANQQTETGTEPEAEELQGIAGANVSASGYGKSVDVGVDTAVSGVQADVSGQSVQSSTAHGVVVNDTELVSADSVKQANATVDSAVNALPTKVKTVTDAVYDGAQAGLAELPEQQSFEAAGVNAELQIQHWN